MAVFNHTAHKELWTWLAENPDKEKWNWPKWKRNGGKENSENKCFACEFARGIDGRLKCCPLVWGKKKGKYSCELDENSPYAKWLGLENHHSPELALQIANLPVEKGVETI